MKNKSEISVNFSFIFHHGFECQFWTSIYQGLDGYQVLSSCLRSTYQYTALSPYQQLHHEYQFHGLDQTGWDYV